jgi:hypothetical protein
MSKVDTAAIVRGLDPADWVRIDLIRKLPFEERIKPVMEEAEFICARTREEFRHLYPNFNESEINLKVIEYLTGDKIPDKYWEIARASLN